MKTAKRIAAVAAAVAIAVIAYLIGQSGSTVVVANSDNSASLEALNKIAGQIASLEVSISDMRDENAVLTAHIASIEYELAEVKACSCKVNPCAAVITQTEYITVPVFVSPVYTKTMVVTETVYLTETVEEHSEVLSTTITVKNDEEIKRETKHENSELEETVYKDSHDDSSGSNDDGANDDTSTNDDTPAEQPKIEQPKHDDKPQSDNGSDKPKNDKPKCNQGVGNGAEGCSPGKSDSTVSDKHPHGPNDEGENNVPGNPGRKVEAKENKVNDDAKNDDKPVNDKPAKKDK